MSIKDDLTGKNSPSAVRLRNRIKALNEVIGKATEERDALVRLGERKGWLRQMDRTRRKLGNDVVVGSKKMMERDGAEYLPPRTE